MQITLEWENSYKNLDRVEDLVRIFSLQSDLIVLPEMFTTGFTMHARQLAEESDGPTMQRVKQWAVSCNVAIAGSFIATQDGHYFNRGFFAYPDGEVVFYDKRHLFRMAGEDKTFTAGEKQCIVAYKGWNICLQICYDLRFPVWSRNIDNGYDLLLYCANWPKPRREPWKILLPARAVENLSYVCGVNRVGSDKAGNVYWGDSMAIDMKGEILCHLEETEQCVTVELDYDKLQRFREKFACWKDADRFTLTL